MARFFRRGTSKIYVCPSISNTSSPTTGELNAGVDISSSIADISGLQLSNNPIATPDLSTGFDTSITGPDQAATTTTTHYDDNASTTVRTALAKGTSFFVVLLPYGRINGKRAEVWPAVSTGVNDEYTLSAEAAKYQVGYAISSTPVQNAVCPT